jgi:hypothetical protein
MGSISTLLKRFGALTLIVALLGLVIYVQATRDRTDKNGCSTKRAAGRVTFVVVDQSDPFERADREMVDDVVTDWMATSKRGDRIEIFTPDLDKPFEPTVRFEACAPANPGTANPLVSTAKKLRPDWEIFEKRLRSAIVDALSSEVAESSPLVETVVALSREPEFRRAHDREIILISDLMQKSDAANFYKGVPADPERFAAGSNLGKAELKDVKVKVRYAARRSQWQKRETVRTFWRRWIEWQSGGFAVETE